MADIIKIKRDNFRRLFKETKVKKKDVAKILDCTPPAVSALLRSRNAEGFRSLSDERIELIVAGLKKYHGVDIDELYFYEGLFCKENTPSKHKDLVEKVVEIMDSDTHFADSLRANINSFHAAIRSEERVAELEQRLNRFIERTHDRRKSNKKIDFEDRRNGEERRKGADRPA